MYDTYANGKEADVLECSTSRLRHGRGQCCSGLRLDWHPVTKRRETGQKECCASLNIKETNREEREKRERKTGIEKIKRDRETEKQAHRETDSRRDVHTQRQKKETEQAKRKERERGTEGERDEKMVPRRDSKIKQQTAAAM